MTNAIAGTEFRSGLVSDFPYSRQKTLSAGNKKPQSNLASTVVIRSVVPMWELPSLYTDYDTATTTRHPRAAYSCGAQSLS